jgi:hypothetical protein
MASESMDSLQVPNTDQTEYKGLTISGIVKRQVVNVLVSNA